LVRVKRRPNESPEKLLKRFRKEVSKSGVLTAARRKRWFVSKSEERRFKERKAIRRARRRQAKQERKGYP
jgi:small subunit ribosomal protein S21